MPLPELPLDILLDIADLLTDDDTGSKLCFADFNSFLKVNRTLYVCLNRTLWRKAVESKSATECVFKHLIHTNDLARLKFFLELGADVETGLRDSDRNSNGTPLQVAVQRDNVPMARLFLAHGANPAEYIKLGSLRWGDAPIHVARSGKMVQLLLDHDADPNQLSRWHGYRPLHWYALRDDVEAMRTILRNGVKVDSRDRHDTDTPLHCAVYTGNLNAAKLLLEHGAEVKNRTNCLNTTLHLAVGAGNIDVVRLLLERWPEATREKNSCGNTPFHSAVVAGHTDMASLLLERWPEATRERADYGYTPLHWAAWYENADMVRLLVESWPEGRQAVDNDGMTPLSLFEKSVRTSGRVDSNQAKEIIALLSSV